MTWPSFDRLATAARTLQTLPDQYLNAQKRFRSAIESTPEPRTDKFKTWSRGKRFDAILCRPEATCGLTAGLIVTARRTEEVAEIFSDLSSTVEQVVLWAMDQGHDFSLYAIFSSAVGRLASSLFSIGPMNGFKLFGATTYGISALLSIAALTGNGGGFSEENSKILRNQSKCPEFRSSLRSKMSRSFNNAKTRAIDGQTALNSKMSKTRIRLAYMNASPHQYGNAATGFSSASHFIFKVVNKLGGSWDKHLAFRVAKNFKSSQGGLLSSRISLCLTGFASVGLGVALQPLSLSVNTLALAGCAVALTLGVIAISLVKIQGWKGYVPEEALAEAG